MGDARRILDRLQDEVGPPRSEGDLAELEKSLGGRLPDDYRAFLLRSNAGDFRNLVQCRVLEPSDHVEYCSIDWMCGICPEEPYCDILSCVDSLWDDDELPGMEDFVEIASGGGTYRVVLAFRGARTGQVYLYTSDESELYKIADTFTAFLAALTPNNDEFPEPASADAAFLAVRDVDVEAFANLIGRDGNVDRRNARGETLLAYACQVPAPKLAKILLENGADPNAVDKAGRPVLEHAVRRRAFDCIHHLLAHGVNTDITLDGLALIPRLEKARYWRIRDLVQSHLDNK